MSSIQEKAEEIASRYTCANVRRVNLTKEIADAIEQNVHVPDGYVLIPVDPTSAMIEAAEEAHMPFGDMGFAISAAISARPEVL